MKNKRYFVFLLFAVASNVLSSPQNKPEGIGEISNNLFNAEMGIHKFIQAVCITSGIALILAGFIQFRKYRKNPIVTKLSSVVFNFCVGLALIGLAFIPFQL